jgi:hypothetical protein
MTLGQNVILITIINKKSHVFFMPMFLVKMNTPFNQCEHFDQVGHFECYDFL